MIADQVYARRRHQSSQLLYQLKGGDDHLICAVVPGSFQGEREPVRVQLLQASIGQRGTIDLAA